MQPLHTSTSSLPCWAGEAAGDDEVGDEVAVHDAAGVAKSSEATSESAQGEAARRAEGGATGLRGLAAPSTVAEAPRMVAGGCRGLI